MKRGGIFGKSGGGFFHRPKRRGIFGKSDDELDAGPIVDSVVGSVREPVSAPISEPVSVPISYKSESMIDYSKFRDALKRLEERQEYRSVEREDLAPPLQESLDESVIQRFEVCYDCLWKVLRRYLIGELGRADAPKSPKPLFRMASQNDLLASPVEDWLAYANARIATTHDYNVEKAVACLKLVPSFIDDAIGLYQTMTETTWE